MNLATIAVVFVVVCWILGSAKSKKGRKRKPKASTRKRAAKAVGTQSPAILAMIKRERELREQADAQMKCGRHEQAEKSMKAAIRQLVSRRKAEVVDDFKRQYAEIGSDLGMVSGDCGKKDAPCAKWHGRIISVLGKTPNWPTLADVDAEALFGNDLPHRVDYVDELLDADEIARQRASS